MQRQQFISSLNCGSIGFAQHAETPNVQSRGWNLTGAVVSI
jgi:hypothetical protein